MAITLVDPPVTPEIRVGVDLERMVNDGIAVLAEDERVYQRSGQLVGVVTLLEGPIPPARAVRRSHGTPIIRPLSAAVVRERLAAGALWMKYDKRSRGSSQILPPEPVLSAIHTRGEWQGVRPLVAVATSPVLRPDGTVLQTPGYDASTGLLYWPSEPYAAVSDAPTLDDARGALDALREIVCDFPFARPETLDAQACSAAESGWLAGILTMFARPAIDGACPLFAVDATTRGTGKSRLVDAASRLVHGRDSARTSLPEDDDEMRKRITSLLLDGDPTVCLDNIVRPIALPSLDAVLTSTTWKDRALGSNLTVTSPHRTVWWATGNNMCLGGDLSRRAIHIRLESPVENPEERTGFRHPELLAWLAHERRRLVASALTILRAYFVAGCPYDGPLWGSFESWSRVVAGALTWAGAPNPLLARATQDPAADEEKLALVALIDGLKRLSPTDPRGKPTPLSARSILDALYPRHADDPPDGFDELREAIEQETHATVGRPPEVRRLGKWLQKVRGRVVGGWKIDRIHHAHKNTSLWVATSG